MQSFRFVVTGGAGFIGSHLVESLLDLGHRVVVVDDFSTGRSENIQPFLPRVELVEGSIEDPEVCQHAIGGADYVLHQAALPSVPRSVRDPVSTHHACVTGTLNVLMAARAAGVRRVVYAASSSAYGNTEELPKYESMPPRPRSPYATAKLSGEYYCHAFYHSYGLETVALRYFNVFGPRQDPGSEYAAAIPKFIRAALREETPIIYGDGEQTRDFTYVDNVVTANLLACEAPVEAVGRVFNVGCGSAISVNELWRRIRECTGCEMQPQYVRGRAGDVRHSCASLKDARRLLGYMPRVGLDEGLSRTIAHFAAAAGA